MPRNFPLSAILMALLIALQAMIPSGYMLAEAEDGGLIITVCGGGQNDRQMVFNPETGEFAPADKNDDNTSDHEQSPCAFSMLGAFVAPPELASQTIGGVSARDEHSPLPRDVAYIFSPSPPLPARGPPHSV